MSVLSLKHANSEKNLMSATTQLNLKNKEYLSLQEKMFDLLNTVKKLEQENKVMVAKSSPSAANKGVV